MKETSDYTVGMQCEVFTPAVSKTIMIDSDFTDDEYKVIINGLNEWQTSTKSLVRFIIKDYYSNICDAQLYSEDTVVIKRISSDDPELVNITGFDASVDLLGYYYSDSLPPVVILVFDRLESPFLMHEVLMHEVGHSLGLRHSDINNTLMYPDVNHGVDCITKYDLAQFCSIYSCKYQHLQSCEVLH